MSVRLNRRGATLPLSLLVIALLGFSVAIMYARISSERRITGDGQAQLKAFAMAQSGLGRYFSSVTSIPGASVDVTYNDLPGGTAQVSLRRLRDTVITPTAVWPAIYAVAARGTSTTSRRYGATTPPAERTVATYAIWTPTTFDLNAAFTSLSGLDKNGNSGSLDGNDNCVGSGVAPVPGVAVPDGTFTGQAGPINGSPDDAPVYIGTPGSGGTAKDAVQIDWAGIVAGTALPPDYTLPTWPTVAQMNNWPIVKANGDLILPSSGKGILIVTGNLVINGAIPPMQWDGIILVGGTIISNGSMNIYGAVVTGLNVKLGMVVPVQTVGNGTKIHQYDSCNIARALNHAGSLERVRNGWTDTWSSY
jgi:Tfp pilus assembly protein PilX